MTHPMTDTDKLLELAKAATQGAWQAFNMVDMVGSAMSADDIGLYVKNSVLKSIEDGGSADRFLFIHADGKDICHVGNGPNGPANAAYLEATQPKHLIAILTRLRLAEAERDSAFNEGVLPCDVMLPPSTIIRTGCKVSTLMEAMKAREGRTSQFTTLPVSNAPVNQVMLEALKRVQKQMRIAHPDLEGSEAPQDVYEAVEVAIAAAEQSSPASKGPKQMKQFYAITPNTGTYPEYINLTSLNPSHVGDPKWKILITVRSSKKADGSVGETATIEITRGEAAEIAKAIFKELGVQYQIDTTYARPLPAKDQSHE